MTDILRITRCPRCDSPAPELHPAVAHEGEVTICPHPWHGREPSMGDIVGRLRGQYRVAIRKLIGADPDSEVEFLKTFPRPPLLKEAADEIERLRAERGHVTHNAEIGLTEIVARDCPHYASAEVVQATVLRDMTSREIVGVQFATLKEPRHD